MSTTRTSAWAALRTQRTGIALDVVVTVLMIASGLALLWFRYVENGAELMPGKTPIPRNWAMVWMVLNVAPVAIRRVQPMLAMMIGLVGFVVVRWWFVPEVQVTSIALFLLLYGAGRWDPSPTRRRWSRGIGIVTLLVVLVRGVIVEWEVFVDSGLIDRDRFLVVASVGIVFNLVFLLASVLAANLARERADRERELAARTLELEAEREENARRAVLDERVRIARELHDVVAHHVSVMGVQAGAARRVMASQPDAAAEALVAVEDSSRQAVVELHRLLGFLRNDDDPDGGLDPTPGLGRLDELVSAVNAAGVDTEVLVHGDAREVPGSVSLSGFRIVQEALTNVLRHARADRALVELAYEPTSLVVTVTDNGRGPSSEATTGGNGLRGMAERASLVGGSVRHGPNPGGGFRVVAALPTDAVPKRPPAANGAGTNGGTS